MPASDYGSYDPEFTQQQIEQCARIVDAARTINTKLVRLGGSAEDLAAAAERMEALSASLDAVTGSRAMQTFRYEFDTSRPNAVLPFNPATGAFNPVAPPLDMTWADDRMTIELAFAPNYESGPDAVQGGYVAALFDQLFAYTVMAHGKMGFTAWLKVDYVKPTLIERRLRFVGWAEKIDGKKFAMRGTCHDGDVEVSRGEGLILGAYDLPVVDGRSGKEG